MSKDAQTSVQTFMWDIQFCFWFFELSQVLEAISPIKKKQNLHRLGNKTYLPAGFGL